MEENLNKELIEKIEKQTEEYKKIKESVEKLFDKWVEYMEKTTTI